MVQDKPWESFHINGGQLLRTPEEYLLYYHSYIINPKGLNYKIDCLARSQDGLHWEKPELGLVEHEGSRTNNIIGKAHASCVAIDPTAPAERRYLMVGFDKKHKFGLVNLPKKSSRSALT